MMVRAKTFEQLSAVGLLVLAFIIMTMLAIWPVTKGEKIRQKLTVIQAGLADFDAVLMDGKKLANSNNLLAKSNGKMELLLSGATEGVAGANLQKHILDYVTKNGGVVSQVQVLPSIPDEQLTRIPVSIDFVTGTKGLRDIIFDLETNEPMLFIKDLEINLLPMERADNNNDNRGRKKMSLEVSMKVVGYAKKGPRI